MARQPAYLIVSRITVYNDEDYDDWTEDLEIANPHGAARNRDEAEARAQQLARHWLRSTPVADMELAAGVRGAANDPRVNMLLERLWECRYSSIPHETTDAQLDEPMQLTDLKPFHVIGADLTDELLVEARQILASTPQRPGAEVE